MVDQDALRSALSTVIDPCSIATGVPLNLYEMGMVCGVNESGGEVEIVLRLTSPLCWQATNIIARVEEVMLSVPGVSDVRCRFVEAGDWLPQMMAPHAVDRLRRLRPNAVDRLSLRRPVHPEADPA